jgi:serine/threonine-protein kinase
MTSDFARQSYGSSGRLRPGSRIAGYLIEEQIGAGGMGAVFRARDEVLGRLAAVKIVAPSAADDEFRARFLRESRIAAAVDSPHIIPVYGAGEAGGLLYIATRFVPGGDLERLRQRSGGTIAPVRVSALLAQVASALDTAHAAGLVHRDVKPHNILVDSVPEQPDHAFLSDFGISKGTGFATGLTATGEFVGTPGFCAPEQITSTSVDGRADQYALACVAFVLLTGELPFRRRDTMAMLYAHVHDPVPSLSGSCPGLPPAVDGVVARALAKSPADRYSRCGEFAAALAEALVPDPAAVAPGRRNRLARTADKPAAGEISPRPASTAASRGHDGSTPGRGRSHQKGKARWIWATGAGAVLAAGVVAAALLHVPFPGLGRAGAAPSQPSASRVPSRPAGPASPGPGTGDVTASRVLAKGSYGFKDLTGITADGTHIWVASYGGNSVTELNAADGTWVATLSGGNYGFNDPTSVSADGTHIWVANAGGNSVTELSAADGTWVATLTGGNYGFNDPYDIAVSGTHIWVGNYDGNSVTELNAADGTWVATLTGGSYGFSGPYDIAVSGTHVWVANNTGRSVTELNAADGTWVATLSGGNYGFNYPTAVAADGNRVWVTDNNGQAVTELNAADGAWVQTLSGSSYGFSHPYGIAAERNHVWVANNTGQSVTELTVR